MCFHGFSCYCRSVNLQFVPWIPSWDSDFRSPMQSGDKKSKISGSRTSWVKSLQAFLGKNWIIVKPSRCNLWAVNTKWSFACWGYMWVINTILKYINEKNDFYHSESILLGSWDLNLNPPKKVFFWHVTRRYRRRFMAPCRHLVAGSASSRACGTVLIVSRKPFRRNFRTPVRFETEMNVESNCHSLGIFWNSISSNAKNWNWMKRKTQWRVSKVTTNSWKMLPLFQEFLLPCKVGIGIFWKLPDCFLHAQYNHIGFCHTLELCIYMCFVLKCIYCT